MNWYKILAWIGLITILAAVLFLVLQKLPDDTDSPSDNNESNREEKIYWGVDSASYTDTELKECVIENYGQPAVWGRYLGTIEDVSVGLDTDEVQRLHDNNIHILVIYNHFNQATGYEHGKEEAQSAIQLAQELNIPDSVAIFADIEPTYKVDSDFINGWFDTMSDSKYEAGIYGVFNENGNLSDNFLEANSSTQENTILWTAYPQKEITSKDDAPDYNPQGPDNTKLYGWQYGIDGEQCNIDTNLFINNLLDYLWQPDDS